MWTKYEAVERFGDNNPKHEKWTNHSMADKEKK